MKFKKISFIAIFISSMSLLFIFWFNTRGISINKTEASLVNIPNSDTAFGGIFFSPKFDETIQYSNYKKIEKDFINRKEKLKIINEGNFRNGLSFGFIGVRNSPIILDSVELLVSEILVDSSKFIRGKMDSVINSTKTIQDSTLKKYYVIIYDSLRNLYNRITSANLIAKQNQTNCKYYLSLEGYEFKDIGTKFYVDKGINKLAVVKWNKDVKNNEEQRKGEYFAKKIEIRYSSATKTILIPISKENYFILKLTLQIVLTLAICISFYFFLGLPFHVLLNISKGNAFCLNNIKYLKQTTYVAIVFYFLSITLPYLFYLIFGYKIPNEIILNSFLTNLMNNFYGLLAIITLIIIKKAFQNGYDLQQEQDLTI